MPSKATLAAALALAILHVSGASLSAAEGRRPAASITATVPDITGALPAAASPFDAPHGTAVATDIPDLQPIHPGQGSAGDITGARRPNPHSRELRQIAIYASIGNTDGVEMLTNQLRAGGVSDDTIRHAIDRINVHGDAVASPMPRHGRNPWHADAGWQATPTRQRRLSLSTPLQACRPRA